jgi:hypothetical protein
MKPKFLAAVASIAAVVAVLLLSVRPSRSDEPKPADVKQAPQEPKAKPETRKAALPDMLKALKDSPECLGYETAFTSSGKQVIFAWFKDKKSVVAWYRGRLHRDLMGLMDAQPSRKALGELKDEDGPVLVVASITPSLTPKIDGVALPISQIAIELYKPLPGGVAINGRFAPKAVDVPGLKVVTPEPEKKAEPPKQD